MFRQLVVAVLLIALCSPAFAADEPFVSIFGGYADNDPNTGAGDTGIFGIRGGTETPVAGGQLALTFNRDGDVKMDTLMFDVLFHFKSADALTRKNRILYNRVSGFAFVGLGGMRYDDGIRSKASTIFSWEVGVGMQCKFNQTLGMRVQIQTLRTGANNFKNYSADLGLGIYF